MDYRNAQAAPSKHLTGIAVVVGVHLLMAWLVVSGVGATIIFDVVPPLVVTAVIPEKPVLPEPKKLEELAPTKFEIPLVQPPTIEVLQPKAPPISTVTLDRRAETNFLTTGVAEPVGNVSNGISTVVYDAPISISASVGVACPNSKSVQESVRYPMQAQREGLSGEVEVEFTVTAAGVVSGERVVSTTNRIFNSAALLATRQFSCQGQGQDVKVKVPYSFKMPN